MNFHASIRILSPPSFDFFARSLTVFLTMAAGEYLPPASGLCIFWIIFVLGTGSSLENYIAFAYWRGVIGVSFVLSTGDLVPGQYGYSCPT